MSTKKYIDEFYLVNIKKIRQLEAKIKGRPFALVGPNGAGKTTVFQAILRLIAALPDAKKPEIWITQGEQSAMMKLKLVANGDVYFVEERFSSKTRSRIRLWKEVEGMLAEIKPAQGKLVEIFGSVLDLTPMMDQTGKEQFAFLKDNIGIDTSGYEATREVLKNNHTTAKNKANMLNAIMKDQQVSDEDISAYAEPKDVEKILQKKVDIKPLQQELYKIEEDINIAVNKQRRIEAIAVEIQKLREEEERLREETKNANRLPDKLADADRKLKKVAQANLKVDEEIKTITEHNIKHNRVVYYLQKKEEAGLAVKSLNSYTQEINELDKSFYDSIAALPFDEIYKGLSLHYQLEDEEAGTPEKIGLYLDDLPFNRNQLSYGMMIKCLIKLAVFLNPDGLNFVYISDWNLLDKKNQDELLEFAEAQDNVQLGIEKVSDTTQIAVEFIEIK